MHTKRINQFVAVIFAVIAVSSIFAISASADIEFAGNGKVAGLDPAASYSYAPVTLSTYASPTYTQVEEGATSISDLAPGLYYFLNNTTLQKTVIWVEGDPDLRTGIGETYYNETSGYDILRYEPTDSFIDGVWTGDCKYHKSWSTYYLSVPSGEHLAAADAIAFESGDLNRTHIKQKMESIVFKYSYAPEEILPLDELYAVSFKTGVRIGCFEYTGDSPSTKIVIYTMNEAGEVSSYSHLYTTEYAAYRSEAIHNAYIQRDFEGAEGWVIGIEVYPFGQFPDTVLFTVKQYLRPDYQYLNTIFFMEYIPSGYITLNNDGSSLPSQYNGANTAYVNGYEDGTFLPDGDITKAEAATILAHIIANSDVIPHRESTFSDISFGDWYYYAFAYLESKGIFDYVSGTRITPEDSLTRGEFAQMIFSASNLGISDNFQFTDITSEHKYYSAIAALANKGIINGYADGTFRPDATVTRAEAVTIINRAINLVADENTVVKSTLKNTFSDIEGHWAEYQILIAANDNVKTKDHHASSSAIADNGEEIVIETDHVKIAIDKCTGIVNSIINKYDNTDINASSLTPWFTYAVLDTGVIFLPTEMEITDGRLHVKYYGNIDAYFIIEAYDNFFTIELDSNIPLTVNSIYFGKLNVSTPYSDDPDSYRISAVAMNVNTNMVNYPGGTACSTVGVAMRDMGYPYGAKLGITFSVAGDRVNGEHRAYLKEIVDNIDNAVGITSTHGGPYTLDEDDLFYDYAMISSNITPDTAAEMAETLNKHSIEQLDLHQAPKGTFVQGDFNFYCARQNDETFTTPAQFKERVGDILTSYGIQLGLHTYSSLVDEVADTIVSNPKWQKQLEYNEKNVLTLGSDISAETAFIPTSEDASVIVVPSTVTQYKAKETQLLLIDEELIQISASEESGFTVIKRGYGGTVAKEHAAGAEIKQLYGWYNMLQPVPGSELFYHVADLTAQAYNEGGFEMIYLDGLESMVQFIDNRDLSWYYYSSFIHRIVSRCNTDPIIEGSVFPVSFWAARGRGGAMDHPQRAYKDFNYNHLLKNAELLDYYYTATLGWFHYSPDMNEKYKNTVIKTMFRDDLDHMGTMGVAYDMSTVSQKFQVNYLETYKTLSTNTYYYSLYSRLRKAGYFSDAVKASLKEGLFEGKEYKIVDNNGSWAFAEMKYIKNKVLDMNDSLYTTGSGSNPFDDQTPYIRIEQRYSTLGTDETLVCEFDETAQVTEATYVTSVNCSDKKYAFKMRVYGNNSSSDALMISLNGYLNFFIPLNYDGWREFILIDADNGDHDGYVFENENIYHRGDINYSNISSVNVMLSGDCTGVMIDDLKAYTISNAMAKNPSVTINGSEITFKTTISSGEYIEYFPELNKAYKHYYNSDTLKTYNGNTASVEEISFEGSVTVPAGDFEYTYNATQYLTSATLRAQVVIGLQSSDLIVNEDTWTVPEVNLPEDLQYATLQ